MQKNKMQKDSKTTFCDFTFGVMLSFFLVVVVNLLSNPGQIVLTVVLPLRHCAACILRALNLIYKGWSSAWAGFSIEMGIGTGFG
jgi:hypothetical protein